MVKKIMIAIGLLPLITWAAPHNLRHGTIITTDLNNIGLKDGDVCKIAEIKEGRKKIRVINCVRKGKVVRQFKQYGTTESAITGTPGNIMYENYIGYVIKEKSTPGRMGSGKRIDFCDGECKRKK